MVVGGGIGVGMVVGVGVGVGVGMSGLQPRCSLNKTQTFRILLPNSCCYFKNNMLRQWPNRKGIWRY